MKYKILERDSVEVMEAAVTVMIDNGWRPQGGICLAIAFNDEYEETLYTQAMVKDKSGEEVTGAMISWEDAY